MKIKRIKFQNYTVFEDQQMEFSPGINVIIGENGTGKTHGSCSNLHTPFRGE